MNVDIHITTCNHTDVKCRNRVGLPSWSNVKSWTLDERIDISKLSINSISNFVNSSFNSSEISKFTILDDGSNIEEYKSWLDSCGVNVLHFLHRGSSFAINDYYPTINSNYVFHIEDDHILFNPKSINLIEVFDRLLSDGSIHVLTFRSGLPSGEKSLGLKGAWGPKGFKVVNDIPVILYNRLGNAHHIMKLETYSIFFPMIGNTGGCESYLNNIMEKNKLVNAEIQLPIYAFHSHTLNYKLDKHDSDSWNMSGDGFEYGIKDMDLYLKSKQEFICTYYKSYPDIKTRETLIDYNYD